MATTTEQVQVLTALTHAIALTFDAIAAVNKALLLNPSAEEERILRRQLAMLELQLANLTEDMTAHIARTRTWSGPTAAQSAEIGALMNEASQLTTAALTQTAAIQFASRVLALATEIAASA